MTLYENVRGRITELREFVENVAQPTGFGNEAADIFRAMLVFNQLPEALKREDVVKVPWGVKPNYYSDPSQPYGPALVFELGGSYFTLEWDGTEYTDGTYSLVQQEDDTWCFEGPTTLPICFDTPFCEDLPDGLRFVKKTGPPQYFTILRFEQALDDRGHYHHTRIEMKLKETDALEGD